MNKKNPAQSSTEKKHIGLTEAGNQAIWYRIFLEEIGYEIGGPILLHRDNKGSVDLGLNPVMGRRSKHIPIKFHAIWGYGECQYHRQRGPDSKFMVKGSDVGVCAFRTLHKYAIGSKDFCWNELGTEQRSARSEHPRIYGPRSHIIPSR